MDTLVAVAPSLIGVLVLAAISTGLLLAFRVSGPWAPLAAIARGIVQLAAISVVLTGVISSPVWIGVALLVMFTIASAVAANRIGRSARSFVMMSTTIAAGVVSALLVVFLTGALELTSRFALAIGAIVIGNTMGIAALTGRVLTRSVSEHWDEVEGWLAIGATPRHSTVRLTRRAVREALIGAIDQTKTTGLVVLPGAFVGAIFGGISPVEAGRFQIVVLAAIMAAGTITAVLVALWMADVRTRPVASD